MSSPLKIAILASGRGSNLQSIIEAIEQRTLNASIVLVISDNKDALALKRAGDKKISNLFLDPNKFTDRGEYDVALAQKIRQQGGALVILAGWMRILSPKFLDYFPDKVINIHPSLLPAFPGQNAQKRAFEYGVKYTGCTVHLVDSGVDSGPIIAQQIIPIFPDDTLEGLTDRILIEEHLLYPRVIQFFSEERIFKEGRRVRIE